MKDNTKTQIALFTVGLLSAIVPAAQAQVQAGCSGSNPGVVDCPGVANGGASNVYSGGILHSATMGDITVNSGDGITGYGTGGFVTTATGDHNITMTKGVGNLATGLATGTNAPIVIGATSENGSIDITTGLGTVQGVASVAQYGIFAASTGVGDIRIDAGGVLNQSGTAGNPGIAAIAATSGGGDIDIVTNSNVTGRQYGIRTTAVNGGDTTITTNGQVRHSTTAGVGIYAIEAVADSGNITLNLDADLGIVDQMVSMEGGGIMTLNLRSRIGTTNFAGVRIAGTGQGVVNIVGGTDFGDLVGGVDGRENTGGITINNEALSGGWSLSGTALTLGDGNDLVNNQGLIQMRNDSGSDVAEAIGDFGGGDDRVLNAGTIVAGASSFFFTSTQTRGGAADLRLGKYRPDRQLPGGAFNEFRNLETFENRGLIVLGGHVYVGGVGGFQGNDAPDDFGQKFYSSDEAGEAFCRRALSGIGAPNPPPDGFLCTDSILIRDSDYFNGTVLSLPGTHFIGAEGSRLLIDVVLGEGVAQRDCRQRAPQQLAGELETRFRLPGADCLEILGGSTSGVTQISVRDIRPKDQGTTNLDGIVLVDVSGGTSAAEHFVLAPDSDGYGETDDGRGFIDKGLFVFPLIYDESVQQHKLVGIPGASAFQLPLLANAAQSLGRQSMGVGLEGRVQGWQSALRSGAQLGGGFWGEIQQDEAERDVVQPTVALGETFAFNNDFDQDTSTMILGGDFIIPSAGKAAWVMGGSIGYARSQMAFDTSGNQADMEGVVLGLHGGYQTDIWYLNAAYGQSFLQADHLVPTYNLSTAGSAADTKVGTEGLRIDSGFRITLADSVHLEPLATLAWVRADVDDLVIASPDNPLATSNVARFDNAVSLRGALGVRVGFEMPISSLRIHYGLTGRYWNEFDGETAVSIESIGPDANLADTFDGNFLDLTGRIGISDSSGNVSGYIDARSTSGDDYSSLGLSAGFRYQW